MVNIICPYIHEYNFSVGKFLKPVVDNIKFKENVNSLFLDQNINDYLVPKFVEVLDNNYIVENIYNSSYQLPVISIGNNNFTSRIDKSFLTFITVLNPNPNTILEIFKNYGFSIKIKPQLDKLYVFPSYCHYRIIEENKENISLILRWGYDSKIRIVHKTIGLRW